MQASLCSAFSSMQLRARPCPALTFKSAVGGKQLLAKQRISIVPAAAPFMVEAKQNSERRQRTAEKARMYNKSRKSEVATRMKKVLVALGALKTVSAESELAPVDKLLAEAYSTIDKAVGKGVLHSNTGARRKARLAKARRNLLVASGLYAPAQ